MNWYLLAIRNYAVFSGRSRRKEYWYFTLFNLLMTMALAVADILTGTFSSTTGMGLLGGLYAVAVLIPSLAVLIRRLHDANRSGWWIWIALIPLAGAIVLLVFLVSDGTPDTNRFGPSPKHVPV